MKTEHLALDTKTMKWVIACVVALCGLACAQNEYTGANLKILRALRSFNKAQVLYRTYGNGFACRLEQLGPPPNGAERSAQAAGLIDKELASGEFAGYHILMNCTGDDYQVVAIPESDHAGVLWCVDKSMVLRTADTAAACISDGKVPPRPERTSPDQFSKTGPDVAHDTQLLGYWIDPSNRLMWAAKDSGKSVSWHKAMKYCRKLRLAGYSDWRLATIDELESLVNLPSYDTEYVGGSDVLHQNTKRQVSGGLLLSYGRQWSSTPVVDAKGHPSGAKFWSFWFDEGRRWEGFEDWAEGDTMNALCVRDAKSAPTKSK